MSKMISQYLILEAIKKNGEVAWETQIPVSVSSPIECEHSLSNIAPLAK